MGISVKEAMKIGGLAKCKIVAGEQGSAREIEYITVMEVPDVIQWLHGNDLLITSLYPIKDDEQAIKRIVSQLVDKGSAALAIKTHRFVDSIPEIIITEGNRLGFPIIEIDEKVTYIDIMTPLMGSIINRSALEQKDIEGVLKWITELSLGGKGIAAILLEVEKLLGNRITVEGEFYLSEKNEDIARIKPLTRSQKKDLLQAKCSISMQREYNEQSIECIVTPITFNDVIYGHITCWQTHKAFREVDFMILDRIVLLLSLEFLKVKTKIDVEQNYKDELLRLILHGNTKEKEEIYAKAKLYGWDMNLNYQVYLIEIKRIKQSLEEQGKEAVYIQDYVGKIVRYVERFAAQLSKHTIVGLKNEDIVLLMPQVVHHSERDSHPHDQVIALAETMVHSLSMEYENADVLIGMGRQYIGLEGIHLGYMEAKKALQLGHKVRTNKQLIHFDDLGVYRLLSSVHNRDELIAIYNETIGLLVDFDQANQSHLLETLREYFANNFILINTANTLFIHVNTLKYKLQKIKQVTGLNIQHAEDRFRLQLGLKIHDFLHTE